MRETQPSPDMIVQMDDGKKASESERVKEYNIKFWIQRENVNQVIKSGN